MAGDIPGRLADPTLIALSCESGAWPRPLLGQALIPDAWMGLVQRADGRTRFVPAGEDPQPQRDERLLLCRNRPITVAVDLRAGRAACGHVVNGTCELTLRWLPLEADLAALAAAMPDETLTLAKLGQVVSKQGAAPALAEFAAARQATELVHLHDTSALSELLKSRLARFLFDWGARLEPRLHAEFSSPSLADHEQRRDEHARRLEQIAARETLERASAQAARRRLDDLSGLLDRLRNASQSKPGAWHELLSGLSPAERGSLLESLWRVTPNRARTAAIIVALDQELAWLAPSEPESNPRRMALPRELGGLRSISHSEGGDGFGRLLVGAARGIWSIEPDGAGAPTAYPARVAEPPRTGFNAVALCGRHLYGTHSQLGCWRWPLDDPAGGEALQPAPAAGSASVRSIVTDGQTGVWFAVDEAVVRLPAVTEAGTTEPHAKIEDAAAAASGEAAARLPRHKAQQTPGVGTALHSLCRAGGDLYAGTAAGAICRFEPAGGTNGGGRWVTLYRGSVPVDSLAAREWSGLIELVIPGGLDGVIGVYPQQATSVRLLEVPARVRRVWAADDLLVAVNHERDRLYVAQADSTGRVREVPLGRMTGQTIQDVVLIPSRDEPA